MTELMQRRRALMAKGEAVDPTLVYELKNRTFNNDRSIDTGIACLTTDKSFTIMCDADFAGQQQIGQSWCLFKMMNSTPPYAGVAVTATSPSSNYMMLVWMTATSSGISFAYSFVGNVKIVFTHSIGSSSMTYYLKIGNNAIITNTLSKQFTPVVSNLAIGGSISHTQKFNGTVNKFALYDNVKSSEEINAFLA